MKLGRGVRTRALIDLPRNAVVLERGPVLDGVGRTARRDAEEDDFRVVQGRGMEDGTEEVRARRRGHVELEGVIAERDVPGERYAAIDVDRGAAEVRLEADGVARVPSVGRWRNRLSLCAGGRGARGGDYRSDPCKNAGRASSDRRHGDSGLASVRQAARNCAEPP